MHFFDKYKLLHCHFLHFKTWLTIALAQHFRNIASCCIIGWRSSIDQSLCISSSCFFFINLRTHTRHWCTWIHTLGRKCKTRNFFHYLFSSLLRIYKKDRDRCAILVNRVRQRRADRQVSSKRTWAKERDGHTGRDREGKREHEKERERKKER